MSARRRSAKAHRDALGSVEKLPSGRYRARYSRDGATFTAPRTFDTKQAAYDWLASERADRTRGTWHDPRLGRVLLEEYARTWLDSRPELSPRTRDHYRNMIERYLLPKLGTGAGSLALGGFELGEITPAVVRTWRAAVLTTARERIAARHARTRAVTRGHPARAWARSRGLNVPATGRLSPALLVKWKRAGSPVPAEVVAPSVREVKDESADAGAATTAGAYAVLRTILNEAVRDGVIPVNPCQIRGAGVFHAKERPTATPEEVATISAHMPAHLAAAVTLAAWSGLRQGELFGLARQHVNLDAGTVRVDRALVYVPGEPVKFTKPKTHSSRRTVYLPPFVTEVLRRHMAERVGPEPDALLFTTLGGSPVTSPRLDAPYRRARRAAGRPELRWHDLRHTGATLAYSAGASVREVQNRLGHSTMRAASIYAHVADDSDRVLAARLDALYAPSPAEPCPPDTPKPPPVVALAARRRAA